MNKNKEHFNKWEVATQNLANVFVKKYFGSSVSDVYWTNDEVGGVLVINDYFFNLDRIVDAMKYTASKKKFFEYYDSELDASMADKSLKVNFKNYLKYCPDKII